MMRFSYFVKNESVEDLTNSLTKNVDYKIDYLIEGISKKYDIAPSNLRNYFVEKYKVTPEIWIKQK